MRCWNANTDPITTAKRGKPPGWVFPYVMRQPSQVNENDHRTALGVVTLDARDTGGRLPYATRRLLGASPRHVTPPQPYPPKPSTGFLMGSWGHSISNERTIELWFHAITTLKAGTETKNLQSGPSPSEQEINRETGGPGPRIASE
jgi:hypothetical protein